ncbi:MAG: DUF5615 family PIN-like protein [bacterium]|nr:DUF5615 family PIN-like protein [bacterium]
MQNSTDLFLFLADENVEAKLIKYLSEKGCNIITAKKGIRNSHLINLAKKEKRILLTHDKDFANQLLYSHLKYEGIIILDVHPPILTNLIAAIDDLLLRTKPNKFTGKLFLLSKRAK